MWTQNRAYPDPAEPTKRKSTLKNVAKKEAPGLDSQLCGGSLNDDIKSGERKMGKRVKGVSFAEAVENIPSLNESNESECGKLFDEFSSIGLDLLEIGPDMIPGEEGNTLEENAHPLELQFLRHGNLDESSESFSDTEKCTSRGDEKVTSSNEGISLSNSKRFSKSDNFRQKADTFQHSANNRNNDARKKEDARNKKGGCSLDKNDTKQNYKHKQRKSPGFSQSMRLPTVNLTTPQTHNAYVQYHQTNLNWGGGYHGGQDMRVMDNMQMHLPTQYYYPQQMMPYIPQMFIHPNQAMGQMDQVQQSGRAPVFWNSHIPPSGYSSYRGYN
uniref:MamL-1 domain-containing protein n=1 Tax=Rhabditophanes sp. KR3021 TaxID=114890 RepID=A0AC35TL30_9BILA